MVVPLDRTNARQPRLRYGLVLEIILSLFANVLWGRRVMVNAGPVPKVWVPEIIEVTRNLSPDWKVAANMPLPEKPGPVNEKSNVESANTFWAPASNKKTTANAGRILDDTRI